MFGESRIWDSKIWPWIPRDSDLRTTALARARSNYKWETHPLVKVGAPHQQTHNCLTVTKIWSWAIDGGLTPRHPETASEDESGDRRQVWEASRHSMRPSDKLSVWRSWSEQSGFPSGDGNWVSKHRGGPGRPLPKRKKRPLTPQLKSCRKFAIGSRYQASTNEDCAVVSDLWGDSVRLS
jgi:hypothetical protein